MTASPIPHLHDLSPLGIILANSLFGPHQTDPKHPERNAQLGAFPRPFAVHDSVDNLEFCSVSNEFVKHVLALHTGDAPDANRGRESFPNSKSGSSFSLLTRSFKAVA